MFDVTPVSDDGVDAAADATPRCRCEGGCVGDFANFDDGIVGLGCVDDDDGYDVDHDDVHNDSHGGGGIFGFVDTGSGDGGDDMLNGRSVVLEDFVPAAVLLLLLLLPLLFLLLLLLMRRQWPCATTDDVDHYTMCMCGGGGAGAVPHDLNSGDDGREAEHRGEMIWGRMAEVAPIFLWFFDRRARRHLCRARRHPWPPSSLFLGGTAAGTNL